MIDSGRAGEELDGTRLVECAEAGPSVRSDSISKRTLGIILLARLVINAQFRIVYPFLPAIGRGLGVPLETASLLVTVRASAGVISPLFGYLSDRSGRRPWMLFGVIALALGGALVAAAPSFGLVLIGFALLGISRASYDPAMQAYVSDNTAYDRRGRVLGFIESSWSVSWLIGVPIAGFLIAAYGWRSPFLVIALLGLISVAATWRLRETPGSVQRQVSGPARGAGESPGAEAGKPRLPWVTPSALAALGVGTLVVCANESIFMIYGAWLETDFLLAPERLGVVSIVVSAAELVGVALAAGLVDRLGKRRALLGGLVLNVMAYLLLPRISGSLLPALAGLIFLAMTSEFCIVSSLPLISEMAPNARGMMMAMYAAVTSAGVMLISIIAPRLWTAGGLEINTGTAAAMALLGAILLWKGVRETQHPPATPVATLPG